MERLCIVADDSSNLNSIRAQLRDVFDLRFYAPDQLYEITPDQNVAFDINLIECNCGIAIKKWLENRQLRGRVIFAIDKSSHHAQIQAAAFGATNICDRPINGKELMTILLGDFDNLARDFDQPSLRGVPSVSTALDALENIFLSAHLGVPLDPEISNVAGEAIVSTIGTSGVASWINIVRQHHSQTYQHSLLVAGIITAFAQKLKLSKSDQMKLVSAAMLHDIGKARVPVSILEKPKALNDFEMNIMRKHSKFGFEALLPLKATKTDILDMVLHHHEYLDGSGYPDKLPAAKISDLVRIVTISDIFGALIELRPYKKPLSCQLSYQTLIDMGPKLDADLRREFNFVKELHVN